MSIQAVIFNLISAATLFILTSQGHRNGIALEFAYLCTNVLAGIFAMVIGSGIYIYGNFSQNQSVLLLIFVLAIAIPTNTLLKSLLVPPYIKDRLDTNKPSYYTMGAVVGLIRAIFVVLLLTASISARQSPLSENLSQNGIYKLFNKGAKFLHILTPSAWLKPIQEELREMEKESVAEGSVAEATNKHEACKETSSSVRKLIEGIHNESDVNKARLASVVGHLDCKSVELLNQKMNYLRQINSLSTGVAGYLIAKEASAKLVQGDTKLSEDEFSLVAQSAISYMNSITVDNIIYHSVLKKRERAEHSANTGGVAVKTEVKRQKNPSQVIGESQATNGTTGRNSGVADT